MLKKLPYLILLLITSYSQAQFSVARRWNEVHLSAIRQDLARPPVQARNLFHVSVAMYDAWAAYDATIHTYTTTYLLGKTIDSVQYNYTGTPPIENGNLLVSKEKAISYAAYRVLRHRYANSPNSSIAFMRFDTLMLNLGYDTSIHTVDYINGTPADLGNYIAQKVIEMGMADGAKEELDYVNTDYAPVNQYLFPQNSGAANFFDVNRWQPLYIITAVDQNNNPIASNQVALCHEWGRVVPFALQKNTATMHYSNGFPYPIYYDTGNPPLLDTINGNDAASSIYKWGNSLVATWSSHLDPNDTTLIDISPASLGNVANIPTSFSDYSSFYDFFQGGDPSNGYPLNPATNQPYTPQLVKRGDYTRVISQYWADGPNSETPPGHWYKVFNDVSDHPLCTKKFNGIGLTLSNLEWDVKGYFTLGGAVHDAAICAWAMKGWYDSPRPISSIRKLAVFGQSSDTSLPHYHPSGFELIPNQIELVMPGDSLALLDSNNLYKIKIKSWKGFSHINNPATDVAGVGWILAENWLPYQRKSFVTPPFAGYVSGHSTYSRAGAEVMTLFTGSEFFPGGISETNIDPLTNFLVFEQGPSTNIILQWATYRDASNEASLSRIWGGIHSPVDDLNGRLIGEKVGIAAFNKVQNYFNYQVPLPAQINSFTLTESNCQPILYWNTLNEFNSETFEIWRTSDLSHHYQKIGSVKAAGQSEVEKSYAFKDENPLKSNYYKIVETDLNQHSYDSYINFIDLSHCYKTIQNDGIIVYPNPASTVLNANIWQDSEGGMYEIAIHDLLGRKVYTKRRALNRGENLLTMSIEGLINGLYSVTFSSKDGQIYSHPITISK